MPIIKNIKRVNSLPYYETHLSIINCFLPVKMTPMEIKVMASFMNLEGDIATYRFGSTAKKLVVDSLKISYPGLCNYIKSLIDKGFLITVSKDILNIRPILLPEKEGQEYSFKLINIGNGV
jgi:hypothetical protein